MNNNHWFFISNLEEFVDHSRSLVFKVFGEVNEIAADPITTSLYKMTKKETEEMDRTLTHDEATIIIKNRVKKQVNKKTNNIRYCLTDKILQSIIEDLNSRMVSNILNVLVSKGELESAFDTDKNDFIFWVKEEDDQNFKPETD